VIALFFNRYYSDEGQAYMKQRLKECFEKRGVEVVSLIVNAGIRLASSAILKDINYAIFLDKDIATARFLERHNIRLLNSSKAIEICDDKVKTMQALQSLKDFPLIPSLFAPLAFKGVPYDDRFVDVVTSQFSFPIIVKENVGSRGKGIHLAKNVVGLKTLHKKLFYVPHHYQPMVGKGGEDIRVYTVGGKAVAAVRRVNKDNFISNTARGGKTEKYPLSKELILLAETASEKLNLNYGSIDFLKQDDVHYFLEANSNAYFKAAEELGLEIAERIVEKVMH